MFIATARFRKDRFDKDEALRAKADEIERRLKDLALDVGLDPAKNIARSEDHGEVRIGISEEMDLYLREAPGSWQSEYM